MLFLDSNIIIAYKNENDVNHDRASNIFNDIKRDKYGAIVISEFIFQEVVTVLTLRYCLKAAIETGEILLEAEEINLIKVSDIFDLTWDIFKKQTGTKLSFVDASNLACLKFMGVNQIATFDKEFKKIKDIKIID